MDLVLNVADYYVLTPYVYPTSWPEDGALRQIISLLVVTNLGAAVLYLSLGALSYYFIFDHDLMKHPHFLENQVRREIKYALMSLPWINFPTVVLFSAKVRGYSKLYDSISDSPLGWPGLFLSLTFYVFFTDMCFYCIHRILHYKLMYKLFHKPHHMWKIPTPFASQAIHPVDAFLQGLPYHIYPLFFPLHKVLYLLLYVFANIWAVSIHDGDYRIPRGLTAVISGSAHHADHHLFFNYNYGQYFTLWDRLGGSYRHPSGLMGKGPHDLIRKLQAEGKLGGDEIKGKRQVNGHSWGEVTHKED
ncbi:lathosterol oxidase-like [Betta splendens]|uniref:Lathosterol oxidase-like n=1 Tax=Betta splendens TaxID=158456 RepID=A0A6P7PAA1_BETSP|nr:lathosterol oxidase-like [Betta splendens]